MFSIRIRPCYSCAPLFAGGKPQQPDSRLLFVRQYRRSRTTTTTKTTTCPPPGGRLQSTRLQQQQQQRQQHVASSSSERTQQGSIYHRYWNSRAIISPSQRSHSSMTTTTLFNSLAARRRGFPTSRRSFSTNNTNGGNNQKDNHHPSLAAAAENDAAPPAISRRSLFWGRFFMGLGGGLLTLLVIDNVLQYLNAREAQAQVAQLQREEDEFRHQLLEQWRDKAVVCYVKVSIPYKMGGTMGLRNVQVGDVLEVVQENVGPQQGYNLCRSRNEQGEIASIGWYPKSFVERLGDSPEKRHKWFWGLF